MPQVENSLEYFHPGQDKLLYQRFFPAVPGFSLRNWSAGGIAEVPFLIFWSPVWHGNWHGKKR
jgi:hypothetical protein